MAPPGITIAYAGLPAAYRRGIGRVAADTGLLKEDGETVTLVRLERQPESCARIDELVAAGRVVALIEPFDASGITHALSHGAYVADHEAEPERVVSAIAAAVEGAVQIPLELMAAVASAGSYHGSVVLSEEESAWLLALASGATVVKIADDFGFSERALFRKLADLYARLGASNRAEALVAAERMGILRLERSTEVNRSEG